MGNKMKILAIYDNGGETLDRYTVIVDLKVDSQSKLHECLGLNEGGDGFSQWSHAHYSKGTNNKHLGKRIRFEDLSEATQKHVAGRIFE